MSEVETINVSPNIRHVTAPGFSISNVTVSVPLADEPAFVQWCVDLNIEGRQVFKNNVEVFYVLTEVSEPQILMLKLTWGGN